ncbi:MAG: hypothetical protein GY950_04340 [bacterium]|nr:hypothetical protein [bacterium]
MDNMDNTLNRFRAHSPAHSLSENFDDRVFAKIKKKKTQRKVAASAALSFAVFGFLFIAQAVFFDKDAGQTELPAHPGRMAAHMEAKEEIHVMEDVIFASSDKQTDYAVEQVAYYEDNITI